MHSQYSHKIEAKKLIDFLGGAKATKEILEDMGSDITIKAIQKMRERDIMPSDVLASIYVSMISNGFAVDLSRFIAKRNDYG